MSEDFTLADAGFEPVSHTGACADCLARLAATLDVNLEGVGDDIPILWHWGLFVPTAPSAHLGADGHPRRHGPYAETFPRRMFAGGRVVRHSPLVVDRSVERHSDVIRVEHKQGSRGEMLLVTVRHELTQTGRLAVVEEQDLVYRPEGLPIPLPDPDGPEPSAHWVDAVVPDRVLLMRFSAATFNAHRIHYDAEYARGVEGYPDLVVHGPLTAMLLAQRARTWLGHAPARFEFRATAPAFVDQRLWLTGEPTDNGIELRAVRADTTTVMTAQVGTPGSA